MKRAIFLLALTLALLNSGAGCGSGRSLPTTQSPAPPTSITYQGATYPYVVFIPSTYNQAHPLPALLLIHGGGGQGSDMIALWQSFAQANGIVLVAPTLPLGATFEQIAPALFPLLIEQVEQSWSLEPRRIYLFGYSAGGYSTYDAGMLDSTFFAAIGVFACIITPDYDWILQKAQRKIPVAIYVGDHDQFFTLAQTRATRDLLLQNGFPVHYVELANQDHNYAAAAARVNQDAWAWMSQHSLPR